MRLDRRVFARVVVTGTLACVAAFPSDAQQARGASDGLPPRDQWQRVPEILAALGATEGSRIADIAAGHGYLTKHLSRKVGASGRVFAVEIGDDELRALAKLKQQDTLTNVEVIAGTETDPRLPAPVDAVVVLNSYHEMTQYRAMLDAIKRALRPGGLFVMVDNDTFDAMQPREFQVSHHMIDPKFVEAELRAAGFEIVNRQDHFIVEPVPQWLIAARRPAR